MWDAKLSPMLASLAKHNPSTHLMHKTLSFFVVPAWDMEKLATLKLSTTAGGVILLCRGLELGLGSWSVIGFLVSKHKDYRSWCLFGILPHEVISILMYNIHVEVRMITCIQSFVHFKKHPCQVSYTYYTWWTKRRHVGIMGRCKICQQHFEKQIHKTLSL